MTLSRRDLFKALFSRDARKGLSISRMGGTLEPGGFVTEIRGLRGSRANAGTYVAVGSLLSYPVWLAGLGVVSWVLVRHAEPGWALTMAIIASLPVILLLGMTLASM